MTSKKLFISLTAIILIGVAFIAFAIRDDHKLNIQSTKVQQITITGGAPGSKWKVLSPQNDSQNINKIVNLLNSSNSIRKSTSKELGYMGLMGYTTFLNIRLQDGTIIDLFPVLIWTATDVLPNGTGYTGSGIPDETIIKTEHNGNSTYYTVKSKLIADYLSNGSKADIPLISN